MKEIIMTGKTTDEAVEKACAELGLARDEVTVEILEMPQKKLFGSSPAKVRVSSSEDEFDIKDLLAGNPMPEKKREEAKPQKAEKKAEHPPVPKAEPVSRPAQAEESVEEEEIPLEQLDKSAQKALEYLKGIAEGIGANKLEYRAAKTERGVRFILDGEDASIVIGRRGETMDAIQYLCTLISSRSDDDYCKITLDVANYRQKREKTLIALAEREAAKVKKSKYNQTLEPMNPYERRIVHSAVQNIEGVKSESIGVEPNRRVVISLISGGKQGYDRRGKGGGKGGRGGDRRGGYNGSKRHDRNDRPQQSQPRTPERTEAAKKADEFKPSNSVPLYGKIDL